MHRGTGIRNALPLCLAPLDLYFPPCHMGSHLLTTNTVSLIPVTSCPCVTPL